jgi:hypothetical protein
MRSTARKSVSRLGVAVLLLGFAVWARPTAAQLGSTAEVDYCSQCAATGGCFPCCYCEEGPGAHCRAICMP